MAVNLSFQHFQEKRQTLLKKFENSSTMTITEQSMSSQTSLGSVMEFAGDLNRKFEHAPHCHEVCCLTLDKSSKAAAHKRVS
jgi:hypothetical protein